MWHTINLPSAVTLVGAYNGDGAPLSLRNLLQWAVGLPQQSRQFMQKAEVQQTVSS